MAALSADLGRMALIAYGMAMGASEEMARHAAQRVVVPGEPIPSDLELRFRVACGL